MSENFGLKIGLEGERKFKKSLAEINNSFKVLGSERKQVASQFNKNDKSTEALTALSEVLNKEIDSQKQKIETLRSALANAAESFGKNDRRTQSWQIHPKNCPCCHHCFLVKHTFPCKIAFHFSCQLRVSA